MGQKISPSFRLAAAMTILAVSLLLFGHFLGLVPDETKHQIDARAFISEALATQLSTSASRSDTPGLEATIDAVVKRNKNVLSIAVRRKDGSIVSGSATHQRNWNHRVGEKSTPTHVRVPLFEGSAEWGAVEIVFTELKGAASTLGVPASLISLIAVVGAAGLALFYFLLKRALRELDPSNVIPERVQNAFNTLAEGVLILDNDDNILLSNTALSSVTGRSPAAMLGDKPAALSWTEAPTPGFPWHIALQQGKPVTGVKMSLQDQTGTVRSFMVNASCIRDGSGKIAGTIATFDDVTDLEQKNEDLRIAVHQLQLSDVEIKQRNEELEYMASHDSLSGCLNRRAFFAKFETMMEQACAGDRHLSCIMVDLDHFKSVNDRFGHGVGDDVIRGVAAVLRANCRAQDIAGRYGGEEFCGVFIDLGEEESRQLAEKIRIQIYEKSPDWFPSGEHATGSIGLAMREGPYGPEATAELTDRADQALYAAKEGGRNRVVLFSNMEACTGEPDDAVSGGDPAVESSGDTESSLNAWMEEHIRKALNDRQLMLYYQPIIAAETGRLIAVEALLRCTSPALADVPVSRLIEAAEQTGLIVELGEWVLETAIAQFLSWRLQGINLPKMSVNVSGIQLSKPDTTDRLIAVVRNSGIEPERLQLEITETARVEDVDLACTVLATLQSMGVQIALDDYGTGQASLVYLRLFTPDMLKIDRSFVGELESKPEDRVLVSALIQLAHNLGARVTAEGVETAQQLDVLRELGCDEAQGFGIAYPMPVDAATRWLQLFSPEASRDPAAVEPPKAVA